MDRRKQKTRRAIYAAFNTLLTQKKYSQITVQEIIDAADVGRSTFYAHFPTKEDLLQEMCGELFDHIFHASPLPAPQQGEASVQQVLTHVLAHMAWNENMVRGLLSSESSNFFLSGFREYMDEFIDRHILPKWGRNLEDISPDFFKNHINGSFITAMQWWFDQDCQPDPATMARQYIRLIDPLLSPAP